MMHGIPIEDGVNDCRWNVRGICTNPAITGRRPPIHFSVSGRDWESKQRCTRTIYGVHLCHGYIIGRRER